jgi:hypothetical protein
LGFYEKTDFCNKGGLILIIIENDVNNLTIFGDFSLGLDSVLSFWYFIFIPINLSIFPLGW